MNINKSQNGNELLVTVEGRIDPITAPQFEQELMASRLETIDRLTLDFQNLEYISSSGLRVLMQVLQTVPNSDGIDIIHANSLVKEIFGVTGLDSLFHIS